MTARGADGETWRMTDPDALNRSFAIPDVLHFEEGRGGLVRAVVAIPEAAAEIYTHGAHVTHYQGAGDAPLLFMSGESRFAPGQAIRGGVPVIFPWFGPKAGDPDAPAHGFGRVAEWEVRSTRQLEGGDVRIEFALPWREDRSAHWSAPLEATYVVAVGATLELELTLRNCGSEDIRVEDALHTYFVVSDVREVSVEGLAGAEYLDKTDGLKRKTQSAEPILITKETDSLYLGTTATCVIEDPVSARRITVEKWGSDSTVVWNPWIAKAKAMPDFGDDEWTRMLCVETVNAADNVLTIAPGCRHTTRAVIRSQRL